MRSVGWQRAAAGSRRSSSCPTAWRSTSAASARSTRSTASRTGRARESQCPVLVNFGGDLRCTGAPPASGAWQVGIESLAKPGQAAKRIELKSGALATSGDARRRDRDRRHSATGTSSTPAPAGPRPARRAPSPSPRPPARRPAATPRSRCSRAPTPRPSCAPKASATGSFAERGRSPCSPKAAHTEQGERPLGVPVEAWMKPRVLWLLGLRVQPRIRARRSRHLSADRFPA